jgi:hypothetical protein
MVDVGGLRTLLEANNAGRDKGDLVGKPAIPASDTPVSNDFGFPVNVRVNGGTVSAIKIDGVATGITATGEWVPLRSKSTITLTYSVAPTWLWFAA